MVSPAFSCEKEHIVYMNQFQLTKLKCLCKTCYGRLSILLGQPRDFCDAFLREQDILRKEGSDEAAWLNDGHLSSILLDFFLGNEHTVYMYCLYVQGHMYAAHTFWYVYCMYTYAYVHTCMHIRMI